MEEEKRKRSPSTGRFDMSGDEPLGAVIGFRLPESVDAALRAQADAEGISLGELARNIVIEWMSSLDENTHSE